MNKDLLSTKQKLEKSDAFNLESPSKDNISDKGRPKGITRFCKVRYYQKYFDVTTSQILTRLRKSIFPFFGGSIFEDGKPDLYGPFWIYF
jgi:hypothetical protein